MSQPEQHDEIPLTMTTGYENLATGSTRFTASVLRTGKNGSAAFGGVEEVLGRPQAALNIPAVTGKRSSITGSWDLREFEGTANTILFARGTRSYKANLTKQASFFLRLREGAAYRRIIIPTLVPVPGSEGRLLAEGRFDIVPLAEVEEEFGRLPGAVYIKPETPDWAIVAVIEPETAKHVKVRQATVVVDGEERTVRRAPRQRKLTI